MFGGTAVPQEVPAVQRADKAWLNDLENIPMFLILALVYAIAGLSPHRLHRLLRGLHRRAHPAYDLLSERDAAVAHYRVHRRRDRLVRIDDPSVCRICNGWRRLMRPVPVGSKGTFSITVGDDDLASKLDPRWRG